MTIEEDRRSRRQAEFLAQWSARHEGATITEAERLCLEALILFKEMYDECYHDHEQEAWLRFSVERLKEILGINIKRHYTKRRVSRRKM